MTRMEEMINELKGTQRVEDLVEAENQIAEHLGTGFLNGDFDYKYLLQVREEVKNIEAERKEKFQEKIPEQIRHASYAR